MITVNDIYNATHDGLDVILHYYPQARECVGKKGTKFKVRPSEKTASATLYEVRNSKSNSVIWKVVDFGDDGRAQSPIDICLHEEGFTRVNEAILFLAGIFDVRDELNHSVNKPDVRKRPANEDEKEGTTVFELLPEIPEKHLKVLGPRVKKEHAEGLHWYEAKWVGHVKNREVTMRYSNDNYPIFLRECLVKPAQGGEPAVKFFKIYEPLNPEKGYRFSYTPAGVKPKVYINGFEELKKQYLDYNRQLQNNFYQDPANEGKPCPEEKLKEAFICSGERDALCCKSMGYTPIWFNSETYNISEEEYREVMKYVERLYNIPDLDSTGVSRGTKLALQYINIFTIWLPKWLLTYRDNRGRPRKDLRDWMEIRDRITDFRDLMELAMPAKFWSERQNKKTGQWSYDIDSACLHNFLRLNGFYSLHDENISTARFIRINGNVVTAIQQKDIRKFVRDWAEERYLCREIRNLILNSPRLGDSALENLTEIDLDFTSFTPTTQLFFFPDKILEATPQGLVEHQGGDGTINNYVWEENIINHRIKQMPPMFTITRLPDDNGDPKFDIQINGEVKSCVMGYVVNSSRIHWRKELEENLEDVNEDIAAQYRKDHKFCIDGDGLTEDEIREQKQNLINKIFTIGYMLHRYKSRSRAWAPQAMDNKIGENGECNGRSGKSFLFQALAMFMKTVKLSGRNPKLMDNPHVFDQITKHTDYVLVDDCAEYLSMDLFYDIITSDLTVNPKNNQSYTIPFEESPKFGFTTNYVPHDFDSSTEARMLYMVYSDYYHQKTETNDYLETRSIRDDFGRDLFSRTYSEDDWNYDINFFMQCACFYLSLAQESIKLLPPMGNIIMRKYRSDMGDNFEDWASTYFAEDSGHLDEFIIRREALEDYTNFSKQTRIMMNKFTKKLKAFVHLCPWVHEYNPAELCNSQGRITRRIKCEDGTSKVEDMIYLRSAESFENANTLNNDGNSTIFTPDEHSEQEDVAPF